MTIKTRWFGKKVKGKALENLAKVLDINLNRSFKAYDGWSTGNIYAKISTEFQENSLKLTASFHSTDYHSGSGTDTDRKRKGPCFEVTKEIPYERLIEANKKC